MIHFTENEFEILKNYVREEWGLDLSKKRVLAECRLSAELEKNGISSLSVFFKRMEEDKTGRLKAVMKSRLTTNYTYFWREPKHFEYLEKNILPELNRQSGLLFYKILCAGCSSGEECYTLAMVLQNYTDRGGYLPSFDILGTDLSEKVLEKARRGEYPKKDLERLPVLWQKKYFQPAESAERLVVCRELKERVRFSYMNLMRPGPVCGQYDLIFCRNVMIYFDEASRKKLIDILYQALRPGGYLFVGHTELLPRNHERFEYVCPAVYRKQGGASGAPRTSG